MVCQSRVNMSGLSIIIRVELSFDPKHNGAYCQLWEVFEAAPPGSDAKAPNLKTVDLNSLPHDQLGQVSEELEGLIKYGIAMHYDELENEYKDFMECEYFNRGGM